MLIVGFGIPSATGSLLNQKKLYALLESTKNSLYLNNSI